MGTAPTRSAPHRPAGQVLLQASQPGSPGLVTHLLGTAGDVRSARYSRELYGLSRLVRDQPTLTAAFDEA